MGRADRLARFTPLTALYIASDLATGDYLPDAATQSLVLQPTGLAYVDTPCETPLSIPISTLRSLHFAPALLAALSP